MNPSRTNRNPWPVAIISFFVLAIIFVVGFVVFALRQRTDLVRQDYYEEEIRFQNQIDRATRTRVISANVGVAYNSAARCIAITLPVLTTNQQPTGTIFLYRPSDARLDQNVPLAVDANGSQRVDAKQLPSGLWKVRMEWKVNGQEFSFAKAIVVDSVAASRQSAAILRDSSQRRSAGTPLRKDL